LVFVNISVLSVPSVADVFGSRLCGAVSCGVYFLAFLKCKKEGGYEKIIIGGRDFSAGIGDDGRDFSGRFLPREGR
jgi:hypothetical protein